jgi:hypothetical protein
MSAPSPEYQVLVDAARSAFTPRAGIPELPAPLNWSLLEAEAKRHGITPLLLQHLRRAPAGLVPEATLDALRAECRDEQRISLRLSTHLLRVLAHFSEQGIPILAYKGPVLAVDAYSDLGLRPFVDLDFLVHPRDLDRARQALLSLGFEAFPQLTPARARAFYQAECECWFDLPERGASVEIHWAVRERVYSFPLDLDGVFQRAQSVQLHGRPVPTVSPEDLLLILCIHGSKHAWSKLKWVLDLDRLLATHPDLDWAALLERAHHLRSTRLLLFSLATAAEVLGTSLPAHVREEIDRDRTIPELARTCAGWLQLPAGRAPGQREETTVYLRSREALRDRLRYSFGMAFTPTLADWEALSLPDALFPLYYVYRPLRLATARISSLFAR